jgi:predicted nucleotidyltransferase
VNKKFMIHERYLISMEGEEHTLLPALFKSPERISILRAVSERGKVSVQSVTRGNAVSKGLASLYLNLLVDNHLLTRENRAFCRKDDSMWRAIKLLLNLDLLVPATDLPPWARGVGMYGSWARGTNTNESDLDLWILVDTYARDLEFSVAGYDQDLSTVTHCEVHSIILTRKKLELLADTDRPFYENLMKNTVTLKGEGLDTA